MALPIRVVDEVVLFGAIITATRAPNEYVPRLILLILSILVFNCDSIANFHSIF